MAHGGSNYNLRDVTKRTTLNLSDSGKSSSEEERAASSVQIDAETDNAISDSGTDDEFDISAETSKLQDKLAQLQDEQQYLGERKVTSVTPKGRLPKVKSRTDEITRREDRRDPKTEEMHLKWDLRRKTEEIDELNKRLLSSEKKISLLQLELQENKLKNFEETEKKELRLKRHEEQLIKLQQKIDDSMSDLEEREQKLANRSKRLEEREQQLHDANRPFSRYKKRDELDPIIRHLEQQKARLEAGFLEEGQDTIRKHTITNHNTRELNDKVECERTRDTGLVIETAGEAFTKLTELQKIKHNPKKTPNNL
ncbi:trichohyalin-like [Dreissena polymorpha]|uniref:trichohyalin-like n=1 Tax=Dreissena polymorpha TaxID=45954 RepID=UPI00226438FC|nr:trichohyalin-like [Dreissena polymorpha]